jgi:hypothetical protein
MPDQLHEKLKAKSVERKTTLRELLIQAVEASLEETDRTPFRLRDASVAGTHSKRNKRIRPDEVNAVIDEMREGFTR